MLHAQWVKERLVQSIYRSSPFRSTLNTRYITGLDMCSVCTENKRVSCNSIQENIRLAVSLRPHQKTRELGAKYSHVQIEAPEWRFHLAEMDSPDGWHHNQKMRQSWSVISLARAVLYFHGLRSTTMRCNRRTL